MSNKILLVRPNSQIIQQVAHLRHCNPPYTLKYIEALFKKENKYEVKLIDCLMVNLPSNKLLKESLKWSPGLIIVYINSLNLSEAINYASNIKKERNILIIAVGQPDSIEKINSQNFLDVIIQGEAEVEIFKLVEKLNNSNIKTDEIFQLFKQKTGAPAIVSDLEILPFPKYTNNELEGYRFFYPVKIKKRTVWGHLLSSRGCPYTCIFCSPITRVSYGKELRLRNPGSIADEINTLIKNKVNIISFDDDNFTASEEHVSAVCQEILKRKLSVKWIAHARIDNITLPLLQIMKDAGCILLRFGIESGSNRILKILKKTNSEINWIQKSKEVFQDAKRIGIATAALFIIGSPTESNDDIEASIDLAKKLEPDFIQVHFFTSYFGSTYYANTFPNTEENNLYQRYHYNAPSEKLKRIRKKFYKNFFFRKKFLLNHLKNYFFFTCATHKSSCGYLKFYFQS